MISFVDERCNLSRILRRYVDTVFGRMNNFFEISIMVSPSPSKVNTSYSLWLNSLIDGNLLLLKLCPINSFNSGVKYRFPLQTCSIANNKSDMGLSFVKYPDILYFRHGNPYIDSECIV